MTAPTSSRAMISQDKLSELQGTEDSTNNSSVKNKVTEEDENSGEIFLLSLLPRLLIHRFFFPPTNTLS